jgi:hypothetical protein
MAMKRSGHHAFVEWICNNLPGSTYTNNAVDGWQDGEWKCPNHSGGKIVKSGTIKGQEENLIMSIEDFDIADWNKFNFEGFDILKNTTFYPILFVRDYRNWLSSCIQRKHGDYGRDVYEYLDIEYLNDRKDLKDGRISLYEKQIQEYTNKTISNLIPISYYRWIKLDEYRTKISKNLNIGNSSDSLLNIANAGKGSSFDGFNYNGNATEMKVLGRYKSMEDDIDFIEYTEKYKNLVNMSKEHLE